MANEAQEKALLNESRRLRTKHAKRSPIGLEVAEFNKAFERATREITRDQILSVQKAVALRLLRKIVLRTPVKTGRARGNWQVTRSLSSATQREFTTVFDKTGARTIEKGTRRIVGLSKPFQIIWIANSVSYIVPLEEGYSKQTPLGMVGVSLAEERLRPLE